MSDRVAIVGLHYHPSMPCRVGMVYNYYKDNKKQNTYIITSDFVHPSKEYDKTKWNDCIKIHVPAYKTNFSIKRIVSHLVFALRVDKQLNRIHPDIVYICIPPNYSALRAVKWAKKHKIKAVIDVVDIWPNANAPSKKIFKTAYKVWGAIRNRAISMADRVILECGIYKDDIPNVKSAVIPLSKKTSSTPINTDHEGIRIVYLGAFSTSYDFDSLICLVKKIKANGIKISVHLIGKGVEKEKVINRLYSAEIDTVDYGVVYDEEKKNEIMSACDFGYNGFKQGMAVGQSYKSLDYMACGLALINSLKGDLKEIIDQEKCGFNFDIESRDQLAEHIAKLTKEDIEEMKNNSFSAFSRYFSWKAYTDKMDEMMKRISI